MSGIQDVAREAGLKSEIVANLFEAILASVARGEKVRIKGIGTFERKLYKGRTLVTPAVNEGEPIKYPDSYVLKFHQSQLAKRRINIVAKKQADAEPKPSKKEKKTKEAEEAKTTHAGVSAKQPKATSKKTSAKAKEAGGDEELYKKEAEDLKRSEEEPPKKKKKKPAPAEEE